MLYSQGMTATAPLRIGELSKRSGVSPHVLRACARRYGLLRPTRSSGGLRLYSGEDLERVRLMREHLAQGARELRRGAGACRDRRAARGYDRRAARARPDRVRARAALAQLAHRVPRRRHAPQDLENFSVALEADLIALSAV